MVRRIVIMLAFLMIFDTTMYYLDAQFNPMDYSINYTELAHMES